MPQTCPQCGALTTQTNIGIFRPMTTGDLYFGLRPFDAGAGTRYEGRMDEVTLYDRALSPAEIHAIFVAGQSAQRKAGRGLLGASLRGDRSPENLTPGASLQYQKLERRMLRKFGLINKVMMLTRLAEPLRRLQIY